MATKTGTWLSAIGAFIVFVGLCFLPAAFGPQADKNMLAAGAVVLSMGLLLMAAGLYVKARALQGTAAPASAAANGKRSRKTNCDHCGQEEPVIQCRVHQLHLCVGCLGTHYDFRSCAYVPSTRRGAPAKSNATAHAQSASN